MIEHTCRHTVDHFINLITRFIKSDSFKECYLYSLSEQNPYNKIYQIIKNEKNLFWQLCRDVNYSISYETTMDEFIVDNDIISIFKDAADVDIKTDLMKSDDAKTVLFKHRTQKKN